jgi:hypothetical protein
VQEIQRQEKLLNYNFSLSLTKFPLILHLFKESTTLLVVEHKVHKIAILKYLMQS